jgi:hypothetical protein
MLSMLPLTSVFALGWSPKSVEGSGKVIKQERNVSSFDEISSGLPAKVELRQGDKEGVTIETDDNLHQHIETVVEGGRLKLRMKEKNTYPKTNTLTIVVHFKQLKEISLGGSGKMTVLPMTSKNLKVDLGGSGLVDLQQLKAEVLTISIGGSGHIVAQGQLSFMNASIGGSGNVSAEKLAVKDAKISIGGSGSVKTWVSEKLNVNIGGSGKVRYVGNPELSTSIGGSGSVARLE